MNDFYVGYLPKAPSSLRRFVRRVIAALAVLTLAAALTLVLAQMPFAHSSFEYGSLRSFEGVVAASPYPALLVQRPGETGQAAKDSQYLLVARGKYGADGVVAGFDGQRVRLQGQLIYRDGATMVEVVPGSIVAVGAAPAGREALRDLGPVTLSGEIVDSKCYLGVMNPGAGKVHRDCAARCLGGGVPPVFASAGGEMLLLVGPNGQALRGDALREFIAEPITVHGELLERGPARLLQIDPSALRHSGASH